jgi:glycine cleavage system H protein
MTVLLVLFTLILFLVFDHAVQKYRTRSVLNAREKKVGERVLVQSPIYIPNDVSLATNHTWMKPNQDETITIGFDELLSRLVGAIEKVSLPRAGEAVVPTVADIAFAVRGRTLRLALPLSGSVVDANPDVLKNPSLLLSDPYGKGWLMRVKARADDVEKSKQFVVRRPIEWLSEQLALVRDFIVMNSQQGQAVVLQEGGLPAVGVLQQFDESVWKDFSQTFACLHRTKDIEAKEIQP